VNVTVSFKKTLLNCILSIVIVSEDSGCGMRQTPAMSKPQLPESLSITTLRHFYHKRFLNRFLP
jgi:hypothetical protein